MWSKKVYLKGWLPPDLSPRFTCRVKLVKHKKSGLIFFYFGLPCRQRNATCKLAATEDYRVFIKLHFGTVQLSIVSPTEWLERLLINLTKLSVIVWESVPAAKSCGQSIWLKLGTEVGRDEIFQKPLWLTSLTSSSGVTGGLSFCPLSTKNPVFKGAFWKGDKTPLVNCAAKWIWP